MVSPQFLYVSMKPLSSQLKDLSLGPDPVKSSLSREIEEEISQWRTMYMDLCVKVSAAKGKSVQGASCIEEGTKATGTEQLRVMDPLPQSLLAKKIFRSGNRYIDSYPKHLDWTRRRRSGSKSPEISNSHLPPRRDQPQIDDTIRLLNAQEYNRPWNHFKNMFLQPTGGNHRNGNTRERTASHPTVNLSLKHPCDPVDSAPHQPQVEPSQKESIDLEHSPRRSSSQLAIQEVNCERSSKQNSSQMSQNTQEINYELFSMRNSHQLERNIQESNLECASRYNNCQMDKGAQGVNSEHSTRRNCYQPDRFSQEANNEQSCRRNSRQRDRNVQDVIYESPVRRNSNLIDRNISEFNFERRSKRIGNYGDAVSSQYVADCPLRRNSKQVDMILPMCRPNRSGPRNSNLIDETFRHCYSDSTAHREGFRNFNKSRWEVMAVSKPSKLPAPQRSKQKDVGPTDKNTKLNVPQRSSRWETMNIDKPNPASNPIKRDPKVVGPVLKKSIPKRSTQWEHVDRSIQIFSCEQELPREGIYQKRAYPQYAAASNMAEKLNSTRLETSSKLLSGQRQRTVKPVAVSKIAGGDSRWESVRIFDTAGTTLPQTLISETFQQVPQARSRRLKDRATAQLETILIDHPPNVSPFCVPQGKSMQSCSSHNPTPIGKTPRPSAQDYLPSSANSISINPLLSDSRQVRVQTEKEIIRVDSPLKNAGIISGDASSRGVSSTAVSVNEERPNRSGVGSGDRGSRSRTQLEAECEVVDMEAGMQRSSTGEAKLTDNPVYTEPPI